MAFVDESVTAVCIYLSLVGSHWPLVPPLLSCHFLNPWPTSILALPWLSLGNSENLERLIYHRPS